MKLFLLLIAYRLVLMLFKILLKHRFTRNMHLIIRLDKEKQSFRLISFNIAEKTEGSLILNR
jgi:hypothetical protein